VYRNVYIDVCFMRETDKRGFSIKLEIFLKQTSYILADINHWYYWDE